MSTNTTELERFHATLSDYLIWNKRGQGQIVSDRAKKLSIEVYKLFRATAQKDRAALREKIIGDQGYGIYRRKDPKTGKRVTWAKEMSLRTSGRGVLSASWLNKRWQKNDTQGRFLAVNRRGRPLGEVVADAGPVNEHPSVTITSFLEGVVKLNAERRIVNQAFANQIADMEIYIARKHQEKLTSLFQEPFTGTVLI
jgi:hypothetical protein